MSRWNREGYYYKFLRSVIDVLFSISLKFLYYFEVSISMFVIFLSMIKLEIIKLKFLICKIYFNILKVMRR